MSVSSVTDSDEKAEDTSQLPVPLDARHDEEARAQAAERVNQDFMTAVRGSAQRVESQIDYCASRTIVALYHGALSTMSELSEVESTQIAALQTLGQMNMETQESISKGMKRNEQMKILLQQKSAALKAQRAEFEREEERKQNFIQNRLNEITAETTEMTKAEGFHQAVEGFVVTAVKALEAAQRFPAAQVLSWNQALDLSRDGIDRLSGLTRTEGVFARLMEQVEKDQPVVFELEGALAAIEVEDEEEPKAGDTKKKSEADSTPPPATSPKPKKAPLAMKDQALAGLSVSKPLKIQTEEKGKPGVKAMPKKAEKKTRYEDEEKDKKRARHESRPSRPKDEEMVPKDQFFCVGKDSRIRVLKENPTNETCYCCQRQGHRAFYCSQMLVLGVRLARFMGQVKFGGSDRRTNLFCTSCYWSNSHQLASKNYSTRSASGWHNQTRSTCTWLKSCPPSPEEVLVSMSDIELQNHLKLHGLYGPEEQKKEEQRRGLSEPASGAEERATRSVSISEEPDRKKQKKEKAEAKRKEEEKKKKELEDLRQQLSDESDIVLHGYLFDETFRCETAASLKKQAKYEK